jgi:hypothetical protein
MAGISDNLLLVSFAACVGAVWALRGKIFSFVTAHIKAASSAVEGGKQRRGAANAQLRSLRTRSVNKEVESVLAPANEEAARVRAVTEQRAKDAVAAGALRSEKLAQDQADLLLIDYRRNVIKVAAAVTIALLKKDGSGHRSRKTSDDTASPGCSQR